MSRAFYAGSSVRVLLLWEITLLVDQTWSEETRLGAAGRAAHVQRGAAQPHCWQGGMRDEATNEEGAAAV